MRLTPTPAPHAGGHDSLDLAALGDWVVPIVVALITGVLATFITARVQRNRDDREAKREAIRAFRNLHRCLQDLALVYEDAEVGAGSHFSGTKHTDIQNARKRAYEHIGALNHADRYLVKRAELPGDDRMGDSDELWQWAKALEAAIDRIDPTAKPEPSAKGA